MKKQYFVPKLRIHGSVDDITGAFGNESFTDTVFASDGVTELETDRGSVDGILIPCKDAPDPNVCT